MTQVVAKPKVRFDTANFDDVLLLDKFIEAMMVKLPYDQRNAWLLKFGWKDRGQTDKHHLYSHEKFWQHRWTFNQSRAVYLQCRWILEDRGMIYNSVTERRRSGWASWR